VVEPPAEDLVCPCCGRAKARIGEEVSEQLEYVPASFKVIETSRPKYACSTCKEGVTVALAPRTPVAKGLATSGLLSHVVVSKYVDHQPLHRLTGIFRRVGVEISRQTLCGWVGQVFALLTLIEEAQWRSVLASEVLCADETPVKVLQEGRKDCARGYLWCYLGDRGEVVFDFSMGRRAETPTRALEEFRGRALLCDAYSGYDRLEREKPGLVRAGCMAHARRGIFEAKDSDPDRALLLLAEFRLLYDVEEAIAEVPCATREARTAIALGLRQERSVPILERMKARVDRYQGEVLPKSPFGKAVGYLRSQWDHLTRFATDGAIPIDNNSVEREVRTVAVGRGNWTFIGHEDAGPWAARLYGLLGTCRLQGVNPFEWLRDVLDRVRDHPPDRIAELTPRLWKLGRPTPSVTAPSPPT
jgi:transposase